MPERTNNYFQDTLQVPIMYLELFVGLLLYDPWQLMAVDSSSDCLKNFEETLWS